MVDDELFVQGSPGGGPDFTMFTYKSQRLNTLQSIFANLAPVQGFKRGGRRGITPAIFPKQNADLAVEGCQQAFLWKISTT